MTLQQAVEEFEFGACQPDGTSVPDSLIALRHQGERSVAEHFGGPHQLGCGGTSAEQCLDPGQKLLRGVGLGQVIVGTGVEASQLVIEAAEGGEHQHGRSAGAPIAPQPLHDRQPIDSRQQQLHHDQLGIGLQGHGLALMAIIGHKHMKARIVKLGGQAITANPFMVDEQNEGRHWTGASPWS